MLSFHFFRFKGLQCNNCGCFHLRFTADCNLLFNYFLFFYDLNFFANLSGFRDHLLNLFHNKLLGLRKNGLKG